MHSSLSTVADLSSNVWEEGVGSNSGPVSLCCRRNLSASALNSSSRGLQTSEEAERLTRGSWRFLAGVGQVPSWKLWELENLLGAQQKDKTLERYAQLHFGQKMTHSDNQNSNLLQISVTFQRMTGNRHSST